MSRIPQPIFQKKLKSITWQKIYTREYGVQYSEIAVLGLSPKARFHIASPSVDQAIVPEENNTAFYIDAAAWKKLVKSLNREYTTHIGRLKKYETNILIKGKEYLDFTKRVTMEDMHKKTNRELLSIYFNYQDKLFTYSVLVWTAFILNNYVADRATSIIKKYLSTHNKEDKMQEIIDSLFQPRKRAAVLELQHEVENAKNLSKEKFEKLYENYKWLSCQDLHNKPWTKQQFRQAAAAFKKQPIVEKKPFRKYIQLLGINHADRNYLSMAQRFVYIKDIRDDFRRRGIYNILPFFAEIAKRMDLLPQDISYVQSGEIRQFLEKDIAVPQRLINERKKGFVMYLDSKKNIVCLQGKDIAIALTRFKLADQNTEDEKITGTVASRGQARGRVVIVEGIKDLSKVKQGSILVAVATHPDYTIAMRKAAAIVTDEGGITSHAAIVAREFGIPCIVGTQNATKLLKDGDRVIVDAHAGIVEKLA